MKFLRSKNFRKIFSRYLGWRVHAGNSDFSRLFDFVLALEPVPGKVVAVVNEKFSLANGQGTAHDKLAGVQPVALKLF